MAIRLADSRCGSGPLLVCHPGGPGLHPDYLAPLEALSTYRTVVTLHPRGTGRSPKPSVRGAYDLTEYVTDLISWIEQETDGGPVDLLGHSHGGIVSILVAIQRPDMVRRLVLLATPAYGGSNADTQVFEGQNVRTSDPAMAEALNALERHGNSIPADSYVLAQLIADILPLWMGPNTHSRAEWQRRFARLPANPDALHHFNNSIYPSLGIALQDLREMRTPTLR